MNGPNFKLRKYEAPERPKSERPFSPYCDGCGREGIERAGGLWCPWCRHWLNDPRGWKLLV